MSIIFHMLKCSDHQKTPRAGVWGKVQIFSVLRKNANFQKKLQ